MCNDDLPDEKFCHYLQESLTVIDKCLIEWKGFGINGKPAAKPIEESKNEIEKFRESSRLKQFAGVDREELIELQDSEGFSSSNESMKIPSCCRLAP